MLTLKLIEAEIKKTTGLIIPFIFGIVISLVVLAAAVFLCTQVFFKEEPFKKQVVAVSAPDNDNLLSGIISSVEEMDSVKEICTFEYTDEETARKMVETGKAGAAVIIPENFIKDIVYGENTPAKVLFTSDSSTGYNITHELLEYGGRMLGNSQAGVYAFIDAYKDTFKESVSKSELFDINLEYLGYVMSRNDIFEYEEISPTGELSVIEYFICSACLVFMLLTGIICSHLFNDNSKVIWKKLKIYGMGSFWRTIFKLCSVFIVTLIALGIFLLFIIAAENIFSLQILKINASVFTALFATSLCVSSFVVFVYHLTLNQIAGVLTLFISSFIMIFLCGGFVPSALMPPILTKAGTFMPAKPMIDVLGTMFVPSANTNTFILLFVWFAVFIFGSIVSLKLREE